MDEKLLLLIEKAADALVDLNRAAEAAGNVNLSVRASSLYGEVLDLRLVKG